MQSLGYDLLIASHIVAPWLVFSRRWLLKGRNVTDGPTAQEGVVRVLGAEGLPRPTDSKESTTPKKKKKRVKHDEPGPAAEEDHQTLRCDSCGAPVPLAEEPLPCPHCKAEIKPLPAVAAAYRRRRWAEASLERAEKAWQRAQQWFAQPLLVAAGLLMFAWSIGFVWAVVKAGEDTDLAGSPRLAFALVLLAWPSGGLGWAIGGGIASNAGNWPKLLPRVPHATFASLSYEKAECSSCGAEVTFAKGRFGAICPYCGSEEIRASLASVASAEARAVEGTARRSILDAYRQVVARQEMFLTFFDGFAILQVLFGVVGILHAIPGVRDLLDLLS